MKKKSIAMMIFIGLDLFFAHAPSLAKDTQTVTAKAPAWPRDALILFGADWCAPCLVEMRQIDALVAAAAPRRLFVAWLDQPRRLPRTATVPRIPPHQAAELFAAIPGGGGRGLPTSVMTDATGTPCALRTAPLAPQDIAMLIRRCATAPDRRRSDSIALQTARSPSPGAP